MPDVGNGAAYVRLYDASMHVRRATLIHDIIQLSELSSKKVFSRKCRAPIAVEV